MATLVNHWTTVICCVKLRCLRHPTNDDDRNPEEADSGEPIGRSQESSVKDNPVLVDDSPEPNRRKSISSYCSDKYSKGL